MAFVVTTYKSESALAAAISPGTVQTFSSEATLGLALDALTSEVITAVVTKGAFFTLVLDASFGANTLISLMAKGIMFTVVEETP